MDRVCTSVRQVYRLDNPYAIAYTDEQVSDSRAVTSTLNNSIIIKD
jgi:hypothetical protein